MFYHVFFILSHSLLFYSDISPSKASLKAHKYFKVAFLVCWPSPWSNPAVASGAQVIPICDGMRIRFKRGSVQPVRYLLICFLICNSLFFLLNQYVYIKGSVDKYSECLGHKNKLFRHKTSKTSLKDTHKNRIGWRQKICLKSILDQNVFVCLFSKRSALKQIIYVSLGPFWTPNMI